jgi:hypothetical protein
VETLQRPVPTHPNAYGLLVVMSRAVPSEVRIRSTLVVRYNDGQSQLNIHARDLSKSLVIPSSLQL